MAVETSVYATKLKVRFGEDKQGVTKTYSNVKQAVSDEKLLKVAQTLSSLSQDSVSMIRKVVEADITAK